jgi:hypothetical protein
LIALRHFQKPEYIPSNGRMIGKDLEANGHSLLEILFWHVPGSSEKNHERPQSL